MENSYGIGVANRYALFMDSDALETINVEEEKTLKGIKENAESSGKIKPVKSAKIKKNEPKKILQSKPIKEEKEKHKKLIEEKTDDSKLKREEKSVDVKEDNLDDKKGRNNKIPDTRRNDRRNFDRHSRSDKTGVKPVSKRDGNGTHNWGSHKDDIEQSNIKIEEESINNTETIEATITPAETEPSMLTLDEWKAQISEHKKPTYNIRKAGEGEDPSQWKTMYALNKKRTETDDEEYDSCEYPQRAGRQKRVLGIDFNFVDSRRGGRSTRGGRDNRRENRGKHVDTEEQVDVMNNDRNVPKVYDERDFPSLG